MMLYLAAHDIERLTLGILEQKDSTFHFVVEPVEIPCLTEAYLSIIDSFLAAHGGSLNKLAGIVVVSSAGSATAMRATHALANALSFARGIPLFEAKKDAGVSDIDMVHHIPDHSIPIALPAYANAVNITTSKKDALKRRT